MMTQAFANLSDFVDKDDEYQADLWIIYEE